MSNHVLKRLFQHIMNLLRVEGVFWRIVNQIDPDFMMAQYIPMIHAIASAQQVQLIIEK